MLQKFGGKVWSVSAEVRLFRQVSYCSSDRRTGGRGGRRKNNCSDNKRYSSTCMFLCEQVSLKCAQWSDLLTDSAMSSPSLAGSILWPLLWELEPNNDSSSLHFILSSSCCHSQQVDRKPSSTTNTHTPKPPAAEIFTANLWGSINKSYGSFLFLTPEECHQMCVKFWCVFKLQKFE